MTRKAIEFWLIFKYRDTRPAEKQHGTDIFLFNNKSVSIMFANLSKLSTTQIPNYQKYWILEVEKFIADKACNSNLQVSDIAKAQGMSERQFYRRVKQILGTTPNMLIQHIRLEQAKAYLENGEYATVAEVAYAVGYNRPEYFSSLFSKWYHKRPVDFKRR